MRNLIISLALALLPFSASAASLKDFDGKWSVDLATTLEKTPEMRPDEDMAKVMLTIDATAKTIRTEIPGRQSGPIPFTVERENATEVLIKRADGRVLKLQPYGKGQLVVGEVKDQQVLGAMYFVHEKSPGVRKAPVAPKVPAARKTSAAQKEPAVRKAP